MSKEPIVELKIGGSGEELVHSSPSGATVDRQPAGLHFYELQWSPKTKGTVLIRHAAIPLEIQNILSVTGVADKDLAKEGLFEIRINATLTNSDTIPHDEARVKTFALLDRISASGWKVVIPRSVARIRGKAMTNYLLQSMRPTTLDPSYRVSLGEWMQLESLTAWQFYRDRVFMRIQFTREPTLSDPSRPGAYLISITLKSEYEHFRGYVKPGDRHQWRELLPPALAEMARKRATMESHFRAEGIALDEGYVDPPLPGMQP